MRFISVRELRERSAAVWRELAEAREIVVTSNGKPIAILSAVSEANLEQSLAAIRRARAMAAVEAMRSASLRSGTDRMTPREIEQEIAAVRASRKR